MLRLRIIFHKCIVWLLKRLISTLGMEEFKVRVWSNPYMYMEQVQIRIKKRDVLEEIAQRADRIMVGKRLYLIPDLTLEMFAREVSSNRTYLSKAIHKWRGMSFRHYVNTYRLKYARELYQSSAATPIDMAIGCGFNDLRTYSRATDENYGQMEDATSDL